MAYAYNCLESVVDESRLPRQGNQCVLDFHVDERLDNLNGVGMIGRSDTEAVIGERCVASNGGSVDVAVSKADIPV